MIRALQHMAFVAAMATAPETGTETGTETDSGLAFVGRCALVYGFGISGRAAAELLRHLGADVVVLDRRTRDEVPPSPLDDDPGVRLLLGDEPDDLPTDLAWTDLAAVVVSPGVPHDRPLLEKARAAGVPVLAEVELGYRHLHGSVAAITGSNGKSTTTALAAAIFDAAGKASVACGNIGQPLAALALGDRKKALEDGGGTRAPGRDANSGTEPIRVVELSSFQLETTDRFHARAAALLNLSPDHLDRHGSLDAYRDAKLRIFERQTPSDVAVLNADDPLVAETAPRLPGRCRWFSLRGPVEDGCYLHQGTVVEVDPARGGLDPLFDACDLPLPGPHNLENAMAAALLARSFDVEPESIRHALRNFRGLPHRLERVAERDGVLFFDDSKGTNPAATERSLEGFEDGRVLLILGGVFKGGDLVELGRMVARKAFVAYLIGESAEVFERELRSVPGMTAAVERVGTLDKAVERAARAARTGDVVLLSPACASFDQFANFAERGRVFRDLVRALDPGHGLDAGNGNPSARGGDHGA